MFKNILIVLVFSAGITSLKVQDIISRPIQRNVSKAFYAETGEMVEESQFILSGGSTVQWNDAHGNTKQTYVIGETMGSWANISQPILCKINSGEVQDNIEQLLFVEP
jgi:hypothetical protein